MRKRRSRAPRCPVSRRCGAASGSSTTTEASAFDPSSYYTIPTPDAIHQFSASVFNIGDQLYRNHSSFIKDLAPEIGRGVRFSYMVRFF